jgi:hypothetical protein
MAELTFKIGKEGIFTLYQKMVENIPQKTVSLVDEIASIYERYMTMEAPISDSPGRGGLRDAHTIMDIGEYGRYIYSDVPYFDAVVTGHEVMGIDNSEQQRKWWFWYLKNVLGGDYTPIVGTGNKTEGNDYPTRAFYNAKSDVDTAINNYLNNIGS